MDFRKHPAVHSQLHAAKDGVLEKVTQALHDAGLHDFHIDSIGLYYKRPPKTCLPGEDLVWEPIATEDDETVRYGWVCKPRKS
ncbi:MAG TPA: hypothetical protein VK641_01400 [Terriglobales bacterium]|nr:hypothetical protein [Terriglobales bacterium]